MKAINEKTPIGLNRLLAWLEENHPELATCRSVLVRLINQGRLNCRFIPLNGITCRNRIEVAPVDAVKCLRKLKISA